MTPLPCAATNSVFGLHWRTGDGAVGAEHAAISALWSKLGPATGAHVIELTGIGRHRFHFRSATVWTSDDRVKKHVFP
jgi:hypothetical protein